MAEGRSLSGFSHDLGNVPVDHLTLVDTNLLRNKGVSLTPSKDGLVIFVPNPTFLARYIARRLASFKNRVITALWPAPPLPTLVGLGAFVSYLLTNSKSWWRTGPIADKLWKLDERFNPFKTLMPRSVRIGYLAVVSTFAGLLVMMAGNRLILRMLLRYRGFMYEKRPSLVTKVWAVWLKSFFVPQQLLGSRRHPLTYSFQSALPHLPIPPLDATIDRYIESVTPLMDETELKNVKESASKFKVIGKRLQVALHAKRWIFADNYVSDWWVKYVYLKGRSSLLINSNYYGMGLAYTVPCTDQLKRAATLVSLYAKVQSDLNNGLLEPQMIMGMVPLCMAQYEYLFGTTRVPGRECDTLEQFDANSSHIVVSCLGQYFTLELQHPTSNRHLNKFEIYQQLRFIKKIAKEQGVKLEERNYNPSFGPAECNMALLTTAKRDVWATLREEHLLQGINRASLQKIESASFVLALDESSPDTWTERGKSLLHGSGTDRWVDKSLTLVVFANGKAGVHAEHTWGDAPVVAHTWEMVLAYESLGEYNEERTDFKEGDHVSQSQLAVLPKPSPLRWEISMELAESMEKIYNETKTSIDQLDLKIICFNKFEGGFGKREVKKLKLSPDGFIQMALQLAYRREAGKNCLTYEAGMTRLYLQGRTETVRSLSVEASKFVDAVMALEESPEGNTEAARENCKTLLREAINRHTLKSKEAMTGSGIDRHLFALYVVGKGLGYVDEDLGFLQSALSIPWTMSTSQLPQRQSSGIWKEPPNRANTSPSGGFGPVADDGYGISYMVAGEDYLFFHVSSKTHTSSGERTSTNSERFAGRIKQALTDIMEICS